MMKLKVWGGAGEHGRSAYVLSSNQIHLLLDCGVKREGTGEYPLMEPELVPRLTAVFLSHAHEDHSVAIPLLYGMGYEGEVWTTQETASQVGGYFESWRAFAKQCGTALPYTDADYRSIRYRFLDKEADKLTWFEAAPGVQVMWGRSGHMAGSVWLLLRVEGKTIFYSGDYTAESMLLGDDSPGSSASYADLAIIDAAYSTDRDSQQDKLNTLEAAISSTILGGGKVLLPVPATGRGQEMLLWAYTTYRDCPIVIEQGLLDGMERLLRYPEWLRQHADCTGQEIVDQLEPFLHRNDLLVPENEGQRSYWLRTLNASIWFTTDGMMQSQLARWYYDQLRDDSRNLVLLTGHAAKGTFAEQLLQEPSKYGDCDVQKRRYKVHQGYEDVRRMISTIPARHNVLVHAAKEETDQLRQQLLQDVAAQSTQIQIHSLSASEELWF
ncbi:MBL fold metallo-hydrolase [Paenibacillus sanguinis]|uniref:MBL fold metallo-hydrolase n=1 Tax=Paenibacillus sanguinis TaxID=225906 RepID=UPI0003700C98|nr:MBL fold metallo-hydrolase [Paenibacillus sanguinis]